MKKIIVFILAVIYLCASTGTTLYMHYCMGELVSLNFGHNKEHKEKCSKCGMVNKKGCCEDKEKVVKIEKDHKGVHINSDYFKSFNWSVPVTYIDLIPVKVSSFAVTYPVSHAPPLLKKQPIYLRNRVFRI